MSFTYDLHNGLHSLFIHSALSAALVTCRGDQRFSEIWMNRVLQFIYCCLMWRSAHVRPHGLEQRWFTCAPEDWQQNGIRALTINRRYNLISLDLLYTGVGASARHKPTSLNMRFSPWEASIFLLIKCLHSQSFLNYKQTLPQRNS